MLNKQLLTEYRFRLELIVAMRTACLKVCETPQVRDAGHGITGIVAEKILELAEAGETNADRLCSCALRRLLQ
jgi:hypothetical protein